MCGFVSVQLNQPRRARRYANGAHSGGSMPAAITVKRIHRLANMPHDLQADDIGIEQ